MDIERLLKPIFSYQDKHGDTIMARHPADDGPVFVTVGSGGDPATGGHGIVTVMLERGQVCDLMLALAAAHHAMTQADVE